MSFPIADWLTLPAALIEEVKAFVRVDHDADDAAIDGFLRSAATLCEDFTGQMLIVRAVTDMLPARHLWQKLKRLPVESVNLVEQVAADGTASALTVDDGFSRIRVTYACGLAADWGEIPASLRQGIVRLAGYLYANRDGVDAGGPPSAVTALWQSFRRMRVV